MEKVRKEKKKAVDYGAEYFLGVYNAKDRDEVSELQIDENQEPRKLDFTEILGPQMEFEEKENVPK